MKLYINSQWIINNNTRARDNRLPNDKIDHSTYIENMKEPSHLLVSKSALYQGSSMFEDSFEPILKNLGYRFKRSVTVGMYEIDYVIEDQIILEVNGSPHTLFHDDTQLVESTVLKQKGLKVFGYDHVVVIGAREW